MMSRPSHGGCSDDVSPRTCDIAFSTSAMRGWSWKKRKPRQANASARDRPILSRRPGAGGRRCPHRHRRGRRLLARCEASHNDAADGRPVTRLTLKLDGKTNGDLDFAACRRCSRRSRSHPTGERIVLRARGGGRSQLFLRELSGFETRAASWHRGGNDALLLTRRPVDRLLASGGSHSPESLGRRRFSDRDRSRRTCRPPRSGERTTRS